MQIVTQIYVSYSTGACKQEVMGIKRRSDRVDVWILKPQDGTAQRPGVIAGCDHRELSNMHSTERRNGRMRDPVTQSVVTPERYTYSSTLLSESETGLRICLCTIEITVTVMDANFYDMQNATAQQRCKTMSA